MRARPSAGSARAAFETGPASLGARSIAACLLVGCFAAERAPAEASGSWLERPRLSGDWGGLRKHLGEHGVDAWATYTSGVWSNLHGGKEDGARYLGLARWGANVDLERAAGLPGTSFHISWHAYHGGQPSADLVGQYPTDALSGDEAEDSIRFYDLYLEQHLFDSRLVAKAGQMMVEHDFLSPGHAALFLNASFGDFGLGHARQIAPFYPLAAPGFALTARPSDSWVARAGVYTADPGEDESGNFGFDWSLSDGATFLSELGAECQPFGRPGSYTLGGSATTTSVRDFGDGGRSRGAYGIYALIDQALVLDAEGGARLTGFLRGFFNFQEERAVIRGAFTAGLVAYGLVPGRERDALGIGWSFTRFGRDYRMGVRASGANVTKQESLLELTYRVQLAGWLTLQPDLQLFFDPHYSRSDAIAAGLTAVITL